MTRISSLGEGNITIRIISSVNELLIYSEYDVPILGFIIALDRRLDRVSRY